MEVTPAMKKSVICARHTYDKFLEDKKERAARRKEEKVRAAKEKLQKLEENKSRLEGKSKPARRTIRCGTEPTVTLTNHVSRLWLGGCMWSFPEGACTQSYPLLSPNHTHLSTFSHSLSLSGLTDNNYTLMWGPKERLLFTKEYLKYLHTGDSPQGKLRKI